MRYNLFSGTAGKILLAGIAVFMIIFLKMRLDFVKLELEKSENETAVLQKINQNNAVAFMDLKNQFAKQEQALLNFLKNQDNQQKKFIQQKTALKNLTDSKSKNWREQKLPKNILQILQEK